jgi:hypothetical protein
LIKPILTKHFVNQTAIVGKNVTFTCETQIDALPLFFFFKLSPSILDAYNSVAYAKANTDLLDKFATPLQDQNNLFNDYATIDPRYVLQRREHSSDSNKDPLSDLETINLHILNTTKEDSAFYLCIVANNPKSFRVTYSFLNVEDAEITTTTTTPRETLTNAINFLSTIANHHDYNSFVNSNLENYFERNKFLILAISCLLVIIVLIVALSMCYCCLQYMRTKRMKEKFKYSAKVNKDMFGFKDMSPSKVNTILERTMSTMRKNFIYSSITPNEIENNQSMSSSTTNSSMLSSQRCSSADYSNANESTNQATQVFTDNVNTGLLSIDSQWEFQKEK